MAKLRVLIADDQKLLSTALESSLSQESDIEVVGTAGNGKEAVELALRLEPDIALIDIRMPVLDGIGAARKIKQRLPDCAVVIMTGLEAHEFLERAILAGADAYLLKDIARAELLDSIRRVSRGECLIEPALLRAVFEGYRNHVTGRRKRRTFPDSLTEREVEMLRLVAEGHANEQIADITSLTLGTVKTHLHRAFQKIGVRDRTQAVLYVLRKGL